MKHWRKLPQNGTTQNIRTFKNSFFPSILIPKRTHFLIINLPLSTLLLRQKKDSGLCKQVGKYSHSLFVSNENRVLDSEISFSAVLNEIRDTQKVQVWRVIPLIREGFSYRKLSPKEDLKSCSVMHKVWEAQDNFLSH